MRVESVGKAVAVTAALVCLALYAGTGTAGTVIIPSSPTTVPVSTSVINDITISVSGTSLGRFSITGSPTDTATASFTPLGIVTSDSGGGFGPGSSGSASFVWSQAHPPEIPTVSLSAGIHDAPLIVTYSNVSNLVCSGGSILRITHITDDLATPTVWDKPGAAPATSTSGQDTMSGTGEKTFHIGITFATIQGHSYTSGACTGSFDFTVEY
jgi:hypothetical protein